jgi:1-deoxy-D-xylulose-5-phosphate reductoisomerase
MVAFCDGAVIAQLGAPDMKLPIQYALTYPSRQPSTFERLDFWKMQALTFERPDTETFRGLAFAYEAGRAGGTLPCTFNAANEVAVAAFLRGEIHFLDIYDIIEQTMSARPARQVTALDDLFAEDEAARRYAASLLKKGR